MKKLTSSLLGLAALLILVSSLHGQAVPTGIRKSDLQAGVGVLSLNNDYTDRKNAGLTLWVDYNFTRLLGVEAEAHFGGIIAPDDIGENSYLIGPKISYHKRKFTVYGKLMVGRATITNQNNKYSASYNVLPAFGGGLEYKISRKFTIRAVDFEVQKWPDFEPNTLSPLAISFGVMYVIR